MAQATFSCRCAAIHLVRPAASCFAACTRLRRAPPCGAPVEKPPTLFAKSQCAFPPTAAEPPQVPLLYFLGRNEWPRPPSLAAARQFTLSALRQAASQLVRASGAPHRVGPRWKSPLRFLQNRSVPFRPRRQSRRGFPFLTSSGGMNPPCGKLLRSLYAPQARPTVWGPGGKAPYAFCKIAVCFSTSRSG